MITDHMNQLKQLKNTKEFLKNKCNWQFTIKYLRTLTLSLTTMIVCKMIKILIVFCLQIKVKNKIYSKKQLVNSASILRIGIVILNTWRMLEKNVLMEKILKKILLNVLKISSLKCIQMTLLFLLV